ncbi:hypothetical protein A2U01_0114558, partial [Trifolium medium]|nr:hypothetical protein [Trifolium medium]
PASEDFRGSEVVKPLKASEVLKRYSLRRFQRS